MVTTPPRTPVRVRKRRPTQDDATAEIGWTADHLAELAKLNALNDEMPADAPRVLISVRLSVLTQETTSPARQELDQRRECVKRGWRVVGVASDLSVSATKKKPQQRKELGKWVRDRIPEYDIIMFWKLDRFIRRLTHLNEMLLWAKKYNKQLVSLMDTDLQPESKFYSILIQFIGWVAEIEAANTGIRVQSMWEDAKKQTEEWTTGRPSYGYFVHRHVVEVGQTECADCGLENAPHGRKILVQDPQEKKTLEYARDRLLGSDDPLNQILNELKEQGLVTPTCDWSTLARRLSNPATMGIRVQSDPEMRASGARGYRNAVPVLDSNGNYLQMAEPIFTQAEHEKVVAAIERRQINRTPRRSDASPLLGVLICADCGKNLVGWHVKEHVDNRGYTHKAMSRLRCSGVGNCPSGGPHVHTEAVYGPVIEAVLADVGDVEVQVREFTQGQDVGEQIEALEKQAAYYLKELRPGGRLQRHPVLLAQAEKDYDSVMEQLDALDPDATVDRWTKVGLGYTYREHWEREGIVAMGEDLRRAGVTCLVRRWRDGNRTTPIKLALDLQLPEDFASELVRKPDVFESLTD